MPGHSSRKTWVVAAGAAILVAAASSPALSAVIQGPASFGGHTYYLLGSSSWGDAEAEAVTLGGHLVTINDAAENQFVFNTFTDNGTQNRNLWIGLNDLAVEGTYVWASGEAVGFTNWLAGEPNNLFNFEGTNPGRDEDVVHILSLPLFPSLPPGKWNDFAEHGNFRGTLSYGVVEVVTPVPEPEANALMLAGLGLLALVKRRRRARARA